MNALQIFLLLMSSTFIWSVAFARTLNFVNKILIISLTVVAVRSLVF